MPPLGGGGGSCGCLPHAPVTAGTRRVCVWHAVGLCVARGGGCCTSGGLAAPRGSVAHGSRRHRALWVGAIIIIIGFLPPALMRARPDHTHDGGGGRRGGSAHRAQGTGRQKERPDPLARARPDPTARRRRRGGGRERAQHTRGREEADNV